MQDWGGSGLSVWLLETLVGGALPAAGGGSCLRRGGGARGLSMQFIVKCQGQPVTPLWSAANALCAVKPPETLC